MSNELRMRHFKGVKESPMKHNGPSLLPPGQNADEPFEGQGRVFNTKNTYKDPQVGFALETMFFGPWNKSNSEAPSPATAVTIGVWVLFLSMVFGWFFVVLDSHLTTSTATVIEQGFILGLFVACMSWLAMSMSWHPLLPTFVNMGLLISQFFTGDMGIVTILVYALVMGGGFSLGGLIAEAFTISPTIVPLLDASGLAIYVFGGMFVILTYIYVKKFTQTHPSAPDTSSQFERTQRANFMSVIPLFVFTVVFRSLGLRLYDSGLWLSTWVATSTGNAVGELVITWAWFLFMPIVSALAAFLLYAGFQLSIYGSNKFPKNDAVNSRYRPATY